MKTTTIFFLFVIVTNFLFGQTLTTEIKTPLGSTVPYTYYLGEQLNTTQKGALSDSITLNYPNGTEVNPPSATTFYNCHSFAWYRSEGGDKNVWIGWGNSTAEDSYWLDGSYIEVSGIADGEKISYAGDHSAIVLSGTNCRSKWGAWPLVDHPIGYGPYIYNMSQRKYYENFKVDDGPRYICSGGNATYTAPDYVNCTFNWTYDTNSLNQVSGQGTKNFTVTPKSSSIAGQGWVQLTLTVNAPVNKTFSIRKYLGVNMPLYEDLSYSLYTSGGSPVSYMCPNQHYHIYLNNNSGCSLSSYTWSVPSGWSINYTWSNMVSIYTSSTPGGRVETSANTCCGVYTNVITGYFGSGYCGNSFAMSLSPNPSNGETTLSIESTSEDVVLDENAEWGVEIFDQTQCLKEQKTKMKGKENKINTAGWKTGIYLVRVKYKDEYLQGKLVVQ